jgi:hypothetical protein
MGHPLVDKILKEGLQSVNVSMLSKELRLRLMTDAGNALMHANRYREAADAYALAENNELLREQGQWFLQQQKLALAAYFLRHVENGERLEELGQRCIGANEIEAAKAVYETMGNETMLNFLKENFPGN